MLFYYNWQLTMLTMIVAPPIRTGAARLQSAACAGSNLENRRCWEMTRAVQEAHEGQRVVKVYEGASTKAGASARSTTSCRGFAMRMQVAWSAATPIARCSVPSVSQSS